MGAGLLALGVAGCGGKPGEPSTSTAARRAPVVAPEQQVRQVIAAFGTATLRRDVTTICQKLLAPALVENLEQYGRTCESVWEKNLEGVVAPRLTVNTVRIIGTAAQADVTSKAIGEDPADVRLSLVRDAAGWRIANQS